MTLTDAVQDLHFPSNAGHDDDNYYDQGKTSNCAPPSDRIVSRRKGSGSLFYKYTYYIVYDCLSRID